MQSPYGRKLAKTNYKVLVHKGELDISYMFLMLAIHFILILARSKYITEELVRNFFWIKYLCCNTMATPPRKKKKKKKKKVYYGEDTYRKKVVFYLSALKPEVEMAYKASRGRYDLDKPENITGHYRQSNRTTWKNSVIRITRKPLERSLKLKIQLLAEFCHPSCDMNFADPHQKCESLWIKPTTQRNL